MLFSCYRPATALATATAALPASAPASALTTVLALSPIAAPAFVHTASISASSRTRSPLITGKLSAQNFVLVVSFRTGPGRTGQHPSTHFASPPDTAPASTPAVSPATVPTSPPANFHSLCPAPTPALVLSPAPALAPPADSAPDPSPIPATLATLLVFLLISVSDLWSSFCACHQIPNWHLVHNSLTEDQARYL